MKRVLFISSLYYPHIGGIETMITELSHFCHKDNFYTKVLTKRWPFILDWKIQTRNFNLIDMVV